jgi:DNA-directed RNA polymerase subunit RPC12/RpoP
MDIFDHPILCKKCRKEMKKIEMGKDGFLLRAIECPKCKSRVLHPNDEAEYNKFKKLRDKTYRVKMRIVGNSYAVSIPREIVNFIKDQERVMNDMVKLCFNDSKKLSLFFGDE